MSVCIYGLIFCVSSLCTYLSSASFIFFHLLLRSIYHSSFIMCFSSHLPVSLYFPFFPLLSFLLFLLVFCCCCCSTPGLP
uniref:Uncharacterized protein n=1 Tax=Octopus bimaculoides TaxID=37653 RepID=A0A0L8FSJ8_OCTBM